MNIVKLINEYKKLDLVILNRNIDKIYIATLCSNAIFCLLCSFIFKILPLNVLTFTLYSIASFLLSFLLFRKISLLFSTFDRQSYIEASLDNVKYNDDLNLIFSESDMKDIVEACGGNDRIKTELALNDGELSCSTILNVIRNSQNYRNKKNNEAKLTETKEIEEVLKKEKTAMGKQLEFLDKIDISK